MAKRPDAASEAPKMVRYRVLKKCFRNSEIIEPYDRDGKPNYVMAEEGLDGDVLELAPDKAAAPPAAPGGNGAPA